MGKSCRSLELRPAAVVVLDLVSETGDDVSDAKFADQLAHLGKAQVIDHGCFLRNRSRGQPRHSPAGRRQEKDRNLLDLLALLRKMPVLAGEMPAPRPSRTAARAPQDDPSWMTWTGS